MPGIRCGVGSAIAIANSARKTLQRPEFQDRLSAKTQELPQDRPLDRIRLGAFRKHQRSDPQRRCGQSAHDRRHGLTARLIAVEGSVALAADGRAAGPGCPGQAARPNTWWTKARCAGLSFAGTARTWPLASLAMASTPASVRLAVRKL